MTPPLLADAPAPATVAAAAAAGSCCAASNRGFVCMLSAVMRVTVTGGPAPATTGAGTPWPYPLPGTIRYSAVTRSSAAAAAAAAPACSSSSSNSGNSTSSRATAALSGLKLLAAGRQHDTAARVAVSPTACKVYAKSPACADSLSQLEPHLLGLLLLHRVGQAWLFAWHLLRRHLACWGRRRPCCHPPVRVDGVGGTLIVCSGQQTSTGRQRACVCEGREQF